MKKQIHLFRNEKLKLIEPQASQDMEYFESQIAETEKVLNQMGRDLDKIVDDPNWPYEIRAFIVQLKIKHSFQYEGNNFLVSIHELNHFLESAIYSTLSPS